MNLDGIVSLLFACIEFVLLFNLLVFAEKNRLNITENNRRKKPAVQGPGWQSGGPGLLQGKKGACELLGGLVHPLQSGIPFIGRSTG